MTARLVPFGSARAALVAAGALFAAFLVGALTAADVELGISLLMALCYAPLALLNLPLALALWVSVTFVESLQVVSIGPNAAGLLVATAWVGTLGTRRRVVAQLFNEHRGLFAAGIGLLVWLCLSAVWATDPGMAGADIWLWVVAGLVLVVVATTVTTPRHLALIIGAYVAGAALSVTIGIASGGLTSSATAIDTATATEGRLQGGGGNPNDLAAGLVPAIVLAGALLGAARDAIVRWVIAVVVALLGVGLLATQSRGGLVAAIVALAAALIFYPRKLIPVTMLTVLAIALGAWATTSPQAFDRISDFNGGGTGRTELWGVGWQIFKEHPVNGVGLNNFRSEAYRYVRRPGQLEYVDLISERPKIVHNVYLQMLVETGIVGFLLFMAVILGCLRAAWVAARRFDLVGQPRLAEASRAVLVAGIGMLAASCFVSNGPDSRLWTVMALGPALLAMGNRAVAQARERLVAA